MPIAKFDGRIDPTEWVRVHGVLLEDAKMARQRANATESCGDARSYVRAVFAFAEAQAHMFRRMAYAAHVAGRHLLAEEEVLLLQEIAPAVNEHGKVKLAQRWLPSDGGVLFGFRMLFKALGAAQDPPLGEGWARYRQGLDIRDRLTHPKSESDLRLTPADMAVVDAAFKWVSDLIDPIVPVLYKAFGAKRG